MKFLIVSDLHGNWPALAAVVAAEKKIDGIICLGDIVNYGPHPVPCVEWVQDHAMKGWVVQGNHDRALGCNEDPKCSPPYRRLAAAMQAYTATQLCSGAKDYLAHLPVFLNHTMDDVTFVLCHAAPSDPLYAYVPVENMRRWEDEVGRAGHPDFLLVGHTHHAFVRQIGDTTIINPGSVGQPKDGDERAAYAIWDNGIVELRRARYDVQSVVNDLAKCAPAEIAHQLGRILLTGGKEKPEE
ncbi:MAG: YfcE family phosphodiesterase [Lacunisphaera sp.]